MFKSYFKMAWRSLAKNKVSAFINICGLSFGLATAIIILLVVADEFNYDRFNVNLKDIHLLMKSQSMPDGISTGKTTPGPLAASLRNEIPDLKYVARTNQGSELIRLGDKAVYESSLYAEPDFFNMMSFAVLQGNPVAALQQPGSVVITESTAKKFFGQEEALGKTLIRNDSTVLKVAAVIRDVPQNSTNKFDIVIPFRMYEQENEWLKKWDDNRIFTWVQLQPNARLADVNEKLKKLFLQKQDEKNMVLFAYPLANLRLYGQFKNGKPIGGVINTVRLLGIIGVFVLLIACINFMNLATARSEHRAREVGVRKVLGSSRAQLIFQFLSEAFLLSFIALLLGLLLARLALPGFMRLSGKTFTPDFGNWRIWALVLGMGFITALLAGSYPAFYLSRFQPVKVLKRLLSSGGKSTGLFRKTLVTFQFVISIFLIITTIVIYKQINYLQNRPIGYEADNLIDIAARGDMANQFDLVRNELLKIPGVKSVSGGTDNMVRFGGAMNGVQWPGKTADQDFYITVTHVQYDWVKTAGLKMAEGRDFSRDYGADSAGCIINEAAAQRMRLKEPVIGTLLNGSPLIGVVKDFVYDNPSASTRPLIVFFGKYGINHIFVRLSNDAQWKDHLAQIEKLVKKMNPHYPFSFSFTKEEYQRRFDEARAAAQMANTFGCMAIFISCLGLFGLSAFLAERRNKELSIRKVLGASVRSLWFSLSKEFLKPVFIAFVLAAPLAGWLMQQLLLKMDYHIQLAWWMFALAGGLAAVIAIATVSFHGIRAALANPVKSLRAE